MNEQVTKHDCYYYNWGDNPVYSYNCPREYGARCEKFNQFFRRSEERGLEPNCPTCKEFKARNKKKSRVVIEMGDIDDADRLTN